jgi:hypothetical protein
MRTPPRARRSRMHKRAEAHARTSAYPARRRVSPRSSPASWLLAQQFVAIPCSGTFELKTRVPATCQHCVCVVVLRRASCREPFIAGEPASSSQSNNFRLPVSSDNVQLAASRHVFELPASSFQLASSDVLKLPASSFQSQIAVSRLYSQIAICVWSRTRVYIKPRRFSP